MKKEAVIAFYHANYIAKILSSSKKQEFSIYENFPLWNEDEVKEMKAEMYKQKLLRQNKRLRANREEV